MATKKVKNTRYSMMKKAAVEMSKVMGLDPAIKTVGISEEDLLEQLTEAMEIYDPEKDEFSDQTIETLITLELWPEDEEVEEDEEDEVEEDEEETPKPKAKTKPAPKAKAKATGKAVPKHEGSMAQFMDNTILGDGTFEEKKASIKAEAEKRGAKGTPNIIGHIKYRLQKDPKYLSNAGLSMEDFVSTPKAKAKPAPKAKAKATSRKKRVVKK